MYDTRRQDTGQTPGYRPDARIPARRQDTGRQNTGRQDTGRQDTRRQDTRRQDTRRQHASTHGDSKQEATEVAASVRFALFVFYFVTSAINSFSKSFTRVFRSS